MLGCCGLWECGVLPLTAVASRWWLRLLSPLLSAAANLHISRLERGTRPHSPPTAVDLIAFLICCELAFARPLLASRKQPPTSWPRPFQSHDGLWTRLPVGSVVTDHTAPLGARQVRARSLAERARGIAEGAGVPQD